MRNAACSREDCPGDAPSDDLSQFQAVFHAIVRNFACDKEEDQENIRLKRDHSIRVFKEASLLARRLGLPPATERLCLIASLFHDIGRFPQYAGFKTFRDDRSLDHARAGYELLKDGKVLSFMGREEERIVLIAVLLHNRMVLPTRLTGRIRTVVEVVRDADKLDILPIVISRLESSNRGNSVITHGLKPDPVRYSPSLVEGLLSGRLGRYEEMVWENDFALLLLSWVFDFNYSFTCREFLTRGFLERTVAILPDQQVFHDIRIRVESYLQKRIEEDRPTHPD